MTPIKYTNTEVKTQIIIFTFQMIPQESNNIKYRAVVSGYGTEDVTHFVLTTIIFYKKYSHLQQKEVA